MIVQPLHCHIVTAVLGQSEVFLKFTEEKRTILLGELMNDTLFLDCMRHTYTKCIFYESFILKFLFSLIKILLKIVRMGLQSTPFTLPIPKFH